MVARAREEPGVLDPLARMLADEDARQLYGAVSRLAPAKRLAVVLHYIEGLSFRDMARVLDVPVGTLKWRTHEALAELRSLLDPEAGTWIQPTRLRGSEGLCEH
jgi:RNA polymerase sigma-70 factor (ECF subfamily)